MFSTSGDVKYIGDCSVHWEDTMSTLGGVWYIGGFISTLEGFISTLEGGHKYIGRGS